MKRTTSASPAQCHIISQGANENNDSKNCTIVTLKNLQNMLNNNQNTLPAMQHIEIGKLPVKYFSSAVCMGHVRSGFFIYIYFIHILINH